MSGVKNDQNIFISFLHSGNARSRQILCLIPSFTYHLRPERENNHLNNATRQCRRREANPGRQHSKRKRYPWQNFLLAYWLLFSLVTGWAYCSFLLGTIRQTKNSTSLQSTERASWCWSRKREGPNHRPKEVSRICARENRTEIATNEKNRTTKSPMQILLLRKSVFLDMSFSSAEDRYREAKNSDTS